MHYYLMNCFVLLCNYICQFKVACCYCANVPVGILYGTRVAQPMATCRQLPYLHKTATVIVTLF